MAKMPSMHSGRPKSSSKLRHSDGNGGLGILTLVLVTVSLAIFTVSVREGGSGVFTSVRAVVQTITSPVRIAGGYVVAPLQGAGNIMRNLTADEKTLSELSEENEKLRARNVELEESEQTANRLEELLGIRNTYSLQSLAARVIAGSNDSWVATVTIDRGSSSGITVGMPVSNLAGAVGQVIECAGSTATVRLLTDEASSVSAMVQSSRAQGMIEGSPDSTLRLTLIRTDQPVAVGDTVVTSGLGGVFPKGLPIGKIANVEKSPGSTYYDIVVEPFYRPDTLEEVLVITSLTEEQEATSEDIENADQPDLDAASGKAVNSDNKDSEQQQQEQEGSNNEGSNNEGSLSNNSNQSTDEYGVDAEELSTTTTATRVNSQSVTGSANGEEESLTMEGV